MEVRRPVVLQRRELLQHHFDTKPGLVFISKGQPTRNDVAANEAHLLKPGEIFRFESHYLYGGGHRFLGSGYVLKNGQLKVTHMGVDANHPMVELNKILLKKLKKPTEKGVDATPENYNPNNKVANRVHGFKEYVTTFEELEKGWRMLNGGFWLNIVTPQTQYVKRTLWKKLLERA